MKWKILNRYGLEFGHGPKNIKTDKSKLLSAWLA
jgi:hypothetical protein